MSSRSVKVLKASSIACGGVSSIKFGIDSKICYMSAESQINSNKKPNQKTEDSNSILGSTTKKLGPREG